MQIPCPNCNKPNNKENAFCEHCGCRLDQSGLLPEPKASKKTKKQKTILIATIITALAITTVTAGWWIHTNQVKKSYEQSMEMARRYLEVQNYEEAEACYLQAMKIQPKSKETYKELTDLYVKKDEQDKLEDLDKVVQDNLADKDREELHAATGGIIGTKPESADLKNELKPSDYEKLMTGNLDMKETIAYLQFITALVTPDEGYGTGPVPDDEIDGKSFVWGAFINAVSDNDSSNEQYPEFVTKETVEGMLKNFGRGPLTEDEINAYNHGEMCYMEDDKFYLSGFGSMIWPRRTEILSSSFENDNLEIVYRIINSWPYIYEEGCTDVFQKYAETRMYKATFVPDGKGQYQYDSIVPFIPMTATGFPHLDFMDTYQCFWSNIDIPDTLAFQEDGSFSGTSFCKDFNSSMPSAERYASQFHGKVSDLKRLSDTSFEMTMETLECSVEIGKPFKTNGATCIGTDPLNIAQGNKLLLFGPGTETEQIRKLTKDWDSAVDYGTEIPVEFQTASRITTFVLYNVEQELFYFAKRPERDAAYDELAKSRYQSLHAE